MIWAQLCDKNYTYAHTQTQTLEKKTGSKHTFLLAESSRKQIPWRGWECVLFGGEGVAGGIIPVKDESRRKQDWAEIAFRAPCRPTYGRKEQRKHPSQSRSDSLYQPNRELQSKGWPLEEFHIRQNWPGSGTSTMLSWWLGRAWPQLKTWGGSPRC